MRDDWRWADACHQRVHIAPVIGARAPVDDFNSALAADSHALAS